MRNKSRGEEKENRTFKSPQLYPFWLKATLILFGLCMLVVVLNFGKFILMPLAFASILSMLLNPIVVRFETVWIPFGQYY